MIWRAIPWLTIAALIGVAVFTWPDSGDARCIKIAGSLQLAGRCK